MKLDSLLDRARSRDSATPRGADPGIEEAVAASVAYLASDEAERDLARDPYWPKWTSPWWHLLLLHELGLGARIPTRAAERMAAALDAHFLHDFPLRLEDIPPGTDPYRHIVCHCALGSMVQVLHDRGLDLDSRLPWAREWFLRYQLPDGGLNCDEAVYTRATPRSSFTSTLPPAEAVLLATPRPFDARERAFLAAAAEYVGKRGLVRSISRARTIDPSWLVPGFPRFYSYDALRGLRFLAQVAARTGTALDMDALATPLEALAAWFERDDPPRDTQLSLGTYGPDGSGGWRSFPAAERFPLLERVVRSAAARRRVDLEWREALELLAAR